MPCTFFRCLSKAVEIKGANFSSLAYVAKEVSRVTDYCVRLETHRDRFSFHRLGKVVVHLI
jgi:hypothetical protein